ncbi:MAG TPA: hypothetical protein VKP08_17545, partial [Anaerolineales bacterium]|nr:hypothetical protein [Anaerolineales bacterium]
RDASASTQARGSGRRDDALPGGSFLFAGRRPVVDRHAADVAGGAGDRRHRFQPLPPFTPPPSPTAPPDVKITFKKFDVCEGSNYALFVVENVGSVPFRSAYVRVTNRKLNQVVEQSLNAFDMRVKCVLAKNIAPLNPGGTGYVASPKFTWSGRGQKLQAVIMICAEKDLKGACVTKTIEIKD